MHQTLHGGLALVFWKFVFSQLTKKAYWKGDGLL